MTAKSEDVLKALMERYHGLEWVTFTEVPNSTGANARRRADFIAMNMWPSKGYVTHGCEVKVSRADFKNEMKDITKARAVSKYCDFWWLVVSKGVCTVDEVPEHWGLMELHSNGLKVLKQAPQREKQQPDIGWVASLLRSGRKEDDSYVRLQVEKELKIAEERIKVEYERNLERYRERMLRFEKWKDDFETSLGVPFKDYVKPEDMVKRMQLASAVETRTLRNLANQARMLADAIDNVKED